MEIEFREIGRSNWHECVELELHEGQDNFVASNAYSLAQAAYEPDMFPFAIYRDGVMVGFIMYGYDPDLKVWEMCRLMVDKKYQGQGVGRAAVEKLKELVAEKLGHIMFYTSAEPSNEVAIGLYEKLGFQKNGRIVYGEVMMEIRL